MASAISRSSRKPTSRGRREARSIVISGLMAVFLLGCVGPEPVKSDAAATYHCEDGIFFSAEFFGRTARVTTLRNSYLLDRRPSSIGRKYSDGNVFFIQDEDRAVLVGASDGPYRRCAQRQVVSTFITAGPEPKPVRSERAETQSSPRAAAQSGKRYLSEITDGQVP